MSEMPVQMALALDPAPVVEFGEPGSRVRRQAQHLVDIIYAHRGEDSPVSMHEIAERTGLSTRAVQAIIEVLSDEDPRCRWIGSRPRPPFGYYWIRTEDERRRNRNHFLKRALSVLRRARHYDSSEISATLAGQLEVELGE